MRTVREEKKEDENISEEDGRDAPDVMTKQTSRSEQDEKTNNCDPIAQKQVRKTLVRSEDKENRV